MIQLTAPQLDEIRQYGVREFPYECCGVMLGDVENDVKIVRELRPLTNVHEDGHERRFLIDPDEMKRLQLEELRTKRKILGFYHSHPNHPAQPSEYDREWAWHWWSYIIVSILNGFPDALTCWQLDDDRQAFHAEDFAEV